MNGNAPIRFGLTFSIPREATASAPNANANDDAAGKVSMADWDADLTVTRYSDLLNQAGT